MSLGAFYDFSILGVSLKSRNAKKKQKIWNGRTTKPWAVVRSNTLFSLSLTFSFDYTSIPKV